MNRDCTKGRALKIWAEQCGIKPEEVMALGDNFNDLEMLEYAGLPILMGNHCPELQCPDWTRTLANDEDGDSLVYKVEIRGVKESNWNLLKDGVKDKYLSWDTAAFPDGEYQLRVTASDAPSNPRDQALEGMLISDPFLIDNTPPQILNLKGAIAGNKVEVTWKARDARSNIDKAEYSVNGGEWLLVEPVTKLSDSPEEDYHLVIDRTPGEQVIAVRVTDEFDNQAVDKVVVR
jgi:hypothetical protein